MNDGQKVALKGRVQASILASTSSSTPANPLISFQFVQDEPNHSQIRKIRSHAMRHSWRNRKRERVSRNIRVGKQAIIQGSRQLEPKGVDSGVATIPTTGHLPGSLETTHLGIQMGFDFVQERDAYVSSSLSEEEDVPLGENENSLYNLNETIPALPHNMELEVSNHNLATIGSSIIDALSSFAIDIPPDDLELVHHWTVSFPKMMFEAYGAVADFTESTEVWLPLDFSTQASLHGALTHSAMHLASHRPDHIFPLQAIKHKLKAIRLINDGLQDPETMTSDAVITPILRQLQIEALGDNGASVRVHLDGLERIIELRGGFSSFEANWRLARRALHTLLDIKPRWAYPQSSATYPTLYSKATTPPNPRLSKKLEKLSSQFVQFFQELKALRQLFPILQDQYPSIDTAITRLKSFSRFADTNIALSHGYFEEVARLTSLFYLAATWRDSLRSPMTYGNDLEDLNAALKWKLFAWVTSIEGIFKVVLCGQGQKFTNSKRAFSAVPFIDVARRLSLKSWMEVKETLLELLLDQEPQFRSGLCWDKNILLGEIMDEN